MVEYTPTKKKTARRKKVAKPKIPPPVRLVMSLFAPGMSLMHRAGLGWLACTFDFIEREVRDCRIEEYRLPGWPWTDEKPPWRIEPQRITLEFGEPTAAAEFLKRLFAIAFQVKDNLIYLPGQYGGRTIPFEVRAMIQQGLTLTFLQHGK